MPRLDPLEAFVAKAAPGWLDATDTDLHVDGTLAFFDVSGFTRLSERLARLGRIGAETITEIVDDVYEGLIDAAFAEGGDVVQFSGDALLVLFSGDDHGPRAARAAVGMQAFLSASGRIVTESGPVRLRMSAGMHSGRFAVVVLGREQAVPLLFGADVTRALQCEKVAVAGQVLISNESAALLPRGWWSAGPEGMARLRPAAVEPSDAPVRHPVAPVRRAVRRAPAAVRRLVAPPLRELLAHGGAMGEHRPLALAFAFVRDHAAYAETRGEGALRHALVEFGAAVDDVCERWGVLWIGADALVDSCDVFLVAGAPAMAEDDDERLLRAVCDLAAADLPLPLSVGVNHGRVFVGPVGHPERRTYSVTGDPTNLAARVAAHAPPGTVLATPTLLNRVQAEVESTAVAPFAAKGKRHPVVTRAVSGIGRRRTVSARRAPFVGRVPELDDALVRLTRAGTGRGGVLDLVGDPGSGKSRFIEEFLDRVHPSIAVLRTAAEPYATATAYACVRPLLRTAFVHDARSDGRADLEVLDRTTRHAAPELLPWVPLIATALGISAPPTPESARVPESLVEEKIVEVSAALLRAVVPTGTLIVIEDLHWADAASRALLDRVAADSIDAGWLLCSTRRPDSDPLEPGDAEHPHTMVLPPLAEAEARQLLIELAGPSGITDHDAAAVAAQGAGNPLFLVELASADASGDLPETVEQLIGARIDALAPSDRSRLREAAVLGSVVDPELLARVRSDRREPEADPWARLEDFLAAEADGRLRFQHDLVRTTAYEGLAFRRRRTLHAAVGEALLATADSAEAAPLLSLHFHAAARWRESWVWSRRAADAAVAAGAPQEAFALLGRALDAAAHLADLEDPLVARIAEQRADLAHRIGRINDVHATLRLSRLHRSDDVAGTVRCLRKHGDACEKEGRYPQALRWFTRATRVAAADSTAATRHEEREARLSAANIRFYQGDVRRAVTICDAVFADALDDGDRPLIAQAAMQLDQLAAELSPPELRFLAPLAEEIFREMGDDVSLGNLYLNSGIVAFRTSDWARSAEQYRRAAEVFDRIGDLVGVGLADNNLGELLTDQGRDAEARPLLERSLRLFRASRYEIGIALSDVQLARLELRAGHAGTAREYLDDAIERFTRMGAAVYLLDARIRLAEWRLTTGDASRADAEAEEVAAAIRREGAGALLPAIVGRVRAEAAAGRGERQRARDLADDALAEARRERSGYEEVRTLDVLDRLDRLDGTESGPWARQRDERMAELGVVVLPSASWG